MRSKKVRVRSRRLEAFDQAKMAVAIWLMARELVEDKTTPLPDEKNATASGAEEKEAA